MESFCNNYGWTPEQYRGVDYDDIEVMTAIISGRNKADKKKTK